MHSPENFSLYNIDNARTSSMKRPSVYLPTIDIPAEQSNSITFTHNASFATNIFLRFQSSSQKRKTFYFDISIRPGTRRTHPKNAKLNRHPQITFSANEYVSIAPTTITETSSFALHPFTFRYHLPCLRLTQLYPLIVL